MSAPQTLLRTTRALRTRAINPTAQRQLIQRRLQSTSSSGAATQSHATHAAVGGLAGGGVALLIGYAAYHYSGAKTIVNAAKTTKSYYEGTKSKLKEGTPAPNEALEWVKQQATFYAAFVPGGKGMVESTFADIDTIREKHGGEVDKIISEAYEELRSVVEKDLSFNTATEAFQILQKHFKRLTDLAGDSASDILKNHPELESKLGPGISQLRSLGSSIGPEANKLVSDTYKQIRDIVAASGMSAATISKVQKLIQEKSQQVKKLGEKAWDKGMEEAQPYLEKSPKVKELIESNKSSLLTGNIGQLWEKVKSASESGDSSDLESYVKSSIQSSKEKGSDMTSGLASYAQQFLDTAIGGKTGSELMPKFQQMQEIVQKTDSHEVKKFVEDTVQEVKKVLEKRLEEGKKLVDKKSDK